MLVQKGFSLVELIIGALLSTLIVAHAGSFTTKYLVSTLKFQHKIALRDELRSLQSVISKNLKKADFVAFNPPSSQRNYFEIQSSIKIGQFEHEPLNSCILFSSDTNTNGKLDNSHQELRGFRLRKRAIEYRVAGKNCQQNGWHDITDPHYTSVNLFKIELKSHTSWGRIFEVSISASNAINPDIKETLVFIVEVLNAPQ